MDYFILSKRESRVNSFAPVYRYFTQRFLTRN
jgi:hypothetical protein